MIYQNSIQFMNKAISPNLSDQEKYVIQTIIEHHQKRNTINIFWSWEDSSDLSLFEDISVEDCRLILVKLEVKEYIMDYKIMPQSLAFTITPKLLDLVEV